MIFETDALDSFTDRLRSDQRRDFGSIETIGGEVAHGKMELEADRPAESRSVTGAVALQVKNNIPRFFSCFPGFLIQSAATS
jgi:hypothetical protein